MTRTVTLAVIAMCLSGCTLAAAIAASLCRGAPLVEACRSATDYVHGALRHATRPGLGQVAVLDHFWNGAGK